MKTKNQKKKLKKIIEIINHSNQIININFLKKIDI